jgi:hypothetical protein
MEVDEQGVSQVTAAGAVPDSGADGEEDDAGGGHLVEAGTKEVKVVSLAMIALQLYGFDEAVCYEVVSVARICRGFFSRTHAPVCTPSARAHTHIYQFLQCGSVE